MGPLLAWRCYQPQPRVSLPFFVSKPCGPFLLAFSYPSRFRSLTWVPEHRGNRSSASSRLLYILERCNLDKSLGITTRSKHASIVFPQPKNGPNSHPCRNWDLRQLNEPCLSGMTSKFREISTKPALYSRLKMRLGYSDAEHVGFAGLASLRDFRKGKIRYGAAAEKCHSGASQIFVGAEARLLTIGIVTVALRQTQRGVETT